MSMCADQFERRPRVGLLRDGFDRDLLERPAPVLPGELSRFVGHDREQPRTQARQFAMRAQATPGDRPRRLDRVLREIGVADDDKRDARHVGVVTGDDPRECGRIAGRCGADGGEAEFEVHTYKMRPGPQVQGIRERSAPAGSPGAAGDQPGRRPDAGVIRVSAKAEWADEKVTAELGQPDVVLVRRARRRCR